MIESEIKRLADFSDAVRESTIKRLLLVPEGAENWRIEKDSMSFADIAKHLLDADNWLQEKLRNPEIGPLSGESGATEVSDRKQYLQLVDELRGSGKLRRKLIEQLSEEELNQKIHDSRFGGEVSVWWIIVRGNLDHEIHHRGQISVLLKLAKSSRTNRKSDTDGSI